MGKTKAAWTCEAGVDIDNSGFTPLIIKCGKPAKLYGWAALCDDCAPKVIVQSPRKPKKEEVDEGDQV